MMGEGEITLVLPYVAACTATALISSLWSAGRRNTQKVKLNYITYGDRSIPRDQRFTVLHLSDLHLELLSITPERLRFMLKDRAFDLVAFTGDFLDRAKSIPKLNPFLQVIRELQPSAPMFAVLGNHDYVLKGDHLKSLVATLHHHGCHVLRNENMSAAIKGKKINVIGIDDDFTGRSDPDKAFSGIDHGAFNLVLTHDPNIVLKMHEHDFDYLLAGHFHGGQIHWPKPFHLNTMGELVRMNMIRGVQKIDGRPFYISEGLGQTGINIRYGSRPEIALHDIPLIPLRKNTLRKNKSA